MPDRTREARRLDGVDLGAGTSKMDSQNGSSSALHLQCCHIPSRRGIREEHALGDKPWYQHHLLHVRMAESGCFDALHEHPPLNIYTNFLTRDATCLNILD